MWHLILYSELREPYFFCLILVLSLPRTSTLKITRFRKSDVHSSRDISLFCKWFLSQIHKIMLFHFPLLSSIIACHWMQAIASLLNLRSIWTQADILAYHLTLLEPRVKVLAQIWMYVILPISRKSQRIRTKQNFRKAYRYRVKEAGLHRLMLAGGRLVVWHHSKCTGFADWMGNHRILLCVYGLFGPSFY